jgi:RNA polymerase sigma-70 factor (ECF subfamily)
MWKRTLRMSRSAESTEAAGRGSDDRKAVPAFSVVYAEHFGFVWRCLRALGVRESALDDAAQEVFVIVHRRLPEFRGDANLRTWLYGIVRNVAANQRRSQRRKGQGAPPEDDFPDPGPGPLEQLAQREDARFVQRFAAQLDEKKRDLFVLALLEETSMPEVAAALGVPLNTAYTRLRALRHAFRAALANRRGET